ncbi:MAG: hypothetical protein ACLQVM_00760 [Terriglobia bacterium]
MFFLFFADGIYEIAYVEKLNHNDNSNNPRNYSCKVSIHLSPQLFDYRATNLMCA